MLKGKRLRARLKQRGFTQRKFADELGITQPSLHEYFERGISYKRVMKAAELLDLTPQEIRPDIFGS